MTATLTKYTPGPSDTIVATMDTFPIVKRKDEKKFGTYRTRDTILIIYDALAETQRTGHPIRQHPQTHLPAHQPTNTATSSPRPNGR
jgi:hypothetical protein